MIVEVARRPGARTELGSHAMSGAELERRTRERSARATVLANVLGGVIVFAFLAFLLPFHVRPSLSHTLILRSGIFVGVYLALTLAVGIRWGSRRGAPRDPPLPQRRAPPP